MTPSTHAELSAKIARAIVTAKQAHVSATPDIPFTTAHVTAIISAHLDIAFPKKVAAPKAKNLATMTDEEWLAHLEGLEVYRFIDVRRELGKAQAWASTNGVGVSRRRFVNWLNKADKTIGYDARGKSSVPKAPEKPKARYSEAQPPSPADWRYALRYQLDLPRGIALADVDTLCDLDFDALPEAIRAALLSYLNR